VGESPPPPSPWRAICFPQTPGGSVADFWLLLRTFQGRDLVVLEDDVFPCRNAVPYMARWDVPRFTSFFNPRGFPVGPRTVANECFTYSQAMKIPRALAERLRVADPASTGVHDHDNAIGKLLIGWGEPVYYHRSLVEHLALHSVGRVSGPRPLTPPDYVGRDFDALTL
jgi:hypothetical protein